MTSIKQDTNYSKLITELKKLTTETIGSALNQDAQLFQDFTDRFVQSIDEYNSNAAEALNKGSLQALLFENERFSKNVFPVPRRPCKSTMLFWAKQESSSC